MRRRIAQLFIFIVAPLLVLAVPFLLPLKSGRPLLDWHQLLTAQSDQSQSNTPAALTEEGWREPVKLYRWRDLNGSWSFSQEPPPGVKFEVIFVDPDRSLISAPELPVTTPVAEAPSSSSLLDIYNPTEIERILQAAHDTRAMMNNRNRVNDATFNADR